MIRIQHTTCLLILCSLVLLSACYYDSEEDLYGTPDCNLEGVAYRLSVLPILQENCFQCHDSDSNFGGITLEGYDNLSKFVNNGQLLGAIKHTTGFSPMPKNTAQLPACDIEKIEAWIDDGAPNN